MKALLTQLPVPGFRWPFIDPNIPLAAGYLAAWASRMARAWTVELLPWSEADTLGDEALFHALRSRRPDVVGFSVYLWNAERTLALARRLAASGIRTILGGPEVTADNTWLHQAAGDLVEPIGGEGEQAFSELLGWHPERRAPQPSCPDLDRLPSPYLQGFLPPSPDGSVWIETVRGCPYRCRYCYYGKRQTGVRRFPRGWLRDHLVWAAAQGVREVYLMDPALNARHDWEEVLQTLERSADADQLSLHTELQAERLRAGDARRLARAGLGSCEVGLQSSHPEVLARAGRRWDRGRWLDGTRGLCDAGVAVTVGLMVGLPGDDLSRFQATVEWVRCQLPEADLQVFPLAVLPGTRFRDSARELGLRHLPLPPYTVVSTPGYAEEDLQSAFALFEAVTGLELDPLPPPHLAGPWTGGEEAPYWSAVRVGGGDAPLDWVERVVSRAARNLTLWILGWDGRIASALRRLVRQLPHCVLTVVIQAGAGWPLRELRSMRAAEQGEHYLDRCYRLLGGPDFRVLPRLILLLDTDDPSIHPEWLADARCLAEVLWAVPTAPAWPTVTAQLTAAGELVLVTGEADLADLPLLQDRVGTDERGVLFLDSALQEAWDAVSGNCGFRVPEHRVSFP